MKSSIDFVNITISKKDAEIVSDLILREMGELAKLKGELESRGMSILCDINCRQIDLKYLLEKFSKAAE